MIPQEIRDCLGTHSRAELLACVLDDELPWYAEVLNELNRQSIDAGYRRLAADPAEMAAYQTETAKWTSADLGDLAASAAEEYPEYNS